jgi:hypothetical protein
MRSFGNVNEEVLKNGYRMMKWLPAHGRETLSIMKQKGEKIGVEDGRKIDTAMRRV